MPYQFTVERVEYEREGDTALYGRLKSGAIDGPEWVSVPTHSGPPYVAWTAGMEVSGPIASPVTADLGLPICLALQNHPPRHDIVVPSVAVGLGELTPPGLEHTLLEDSPQEHTAESHPVNEHGFANGAHSGLLGWLRRIIWRAR